MGIRSMCWVIFLTCIVMGYTQNDGRYRPAPTIRSTAPRIENGRYRALGDGRYRSSQDGRYIHRDVKYVHNDRPDDGYTGNFFDSDKNVKIIKEANGNKNKLPVITTTILPKIVKPAENHTYNKEKKAWTILHLRDKVDKEGYEYLYETENGIVAEEIGSIQKLSSDDDGLRSRGFYEYTGDDGIRYRVDYVADDNGFVPTGEHIPTTPPYVKKLITFLETKSKKN